MVLKPVVLKEKKGVTLRQLVLGLGPQSGVGAVSGGTVLQFRFDFSCQQWAFSEFVRGFSES